MSDTGWISLAVMVAVVGVVAVVFMLRNRMRN